jgi:hypothetical protein
VKVEGRDEPGPHNSTDTTTAAHTPKNVKASPW